MGSLHVCGCRADVHAQAPAHVPERLLDAAFAVRVRLEAADRRSRRARRAHPGEC